MMKVLRFSILAALTVALSTTPAWSAIEFFGTAKVKPTYYSNFDFDDSQPDTAALNEAGWASGEHIRSEVRLGWKASGEKWRIKMIAEGDLIYNKNNADRSFYVGAEDANGLPNAGSEFGIERAEFGYTFAPALDFSTGWDIRALDIKSGGLLYGDDHPFIGLKGALAEKTKYELLYIPIQNSEAIGVSDSTKTGDWRVYSLKLSQGIGGLTLSPLVAFSDNTAKQAQITYYGLELTGEAGAFKPAFEIVGSDGDFENGTDISSLAMFAGAELMVNKAFKPYLAVRYAQGDDDTGDGEAEGWVGITDIGRFTPLMGMDGNILGEHLASGASIYNSPLYSFSPDRAVGGNAYGGIGNGSSGNNPGQKLFAIGASGDLGAVAPALLYKAQAFLIWYDDTTNLTNVRTPGEDVDEYAGTTFDLQLLWAASKNFSVDYIFSAFDPGEGIEDQVDADDTAFAHTLTFAWAY
ncbi:MAG: hypothetical protein GWO11_01125 [Desulfuromonadales bacterium]|nr:hypothetical protein [Desulfuromonadales bacterium]NIR33107.1 hypothetical protein [Desulfuromonadales bacterium]NIS40595.1 hypothetical protein [Desulfuromonadales bacterium]